MLYGYGFCLVFLVSMLALPARAENDTAAQFVSPIGNDTAAGDRAAPVLTLAKALENIRAQTKKDGLKKAEITLLAGRHELLEPLKLTQDDAFALSIKGEGAAVISGGRKVTGFKADEKGRWVADVPWLKPEPLQVEAGKEVPPTPLIRAIFVNGERRFPTRLPKEGFFKVVSLAGIDFKVKYDTPMKKFEYKPGDLDPKWSNLSDVEAVALHFWVDTHMRLSSIDETTHIVTLDRNARRKLTDDYTNTGARYYIQNVFEALDTPGQFYANRQTGKLYYLPKPGEEIEKAEVIVPVASQFLLCQGKPDESKFVEGLSLKNITLADTNWDLSAKDAGDLQAANTVPGALLFRGTRNVTIESCIFKNLGTYALELLAGCQEFKISNNTFESLGGGGVKITGGGADAPEAMKTGKIAITDNHMHHLGEVYHSAIGILSMHSFGNTFAHNHIHHLYYTGISIGWVWGYKPSVSHNNIVEYNDIHDIGQKLLSDMGGIYMLGISDGTKIRHNRIYNVDSWGYGGWGIYTDEGSSNILIENNLVYRTKTGGFHQHYGKDNIVRNNIFALAKNDQLQRSRNEEHNSFTFEKNIVYWTAGKLLGNSWKNDKFIMDYNTYFNPNAKPEDQAKMYDNGTLEAWQKRGHDAHSIFSDPMFVDPENADFTLKPESPALKQGFVPFDVKDVGVRKPK